MKTVKVEMIFMQCPNCGHEVLVCRLDFTMHTACCPLCKAEITN